jgi:WD40 repeat protein
MSASEDDEEFAEFVAGVADRIRAGEPIDPAALSARRPEWAERLGGLLPAMRAMTPARSGRGRPSIADRVPGEASGSFRDYRVVREIGRGGMGIVHEAIQASRARRVALKVMSPSSRLDSRQLRRFAIEAQAAAALDHPHIVPVIAHGDEGGVPYLAMRLIEGRNLAEVVRDLREGAGRGIPPREAAELARQAAEALDYAHRHGVLHRDLKPSNFLVEADSHLWVADFGLARMRGDSDLTASGDVIGTLRYLSPEQAEGRRGSVDARSDVYSLGATLYELLTLRPAFEGDDRAELLVRIASEEPRFSSKLDAAIPLDLRTIVLKALAKAPADRYATAGDLAADLSRFLADRPILARRPTRAARAARWARRRWLPIAAAGLMAVASLMGLVATSLRSNARLRELNGRLKTESERSDRLAREANDQAKFSERHAVGAQLRLAAQAVEAGQPERAQEILQDIPKNGGGEATRSFAWRYLWHRARRDVVVLVGPTPRFGHMTLSPDGEILATTDPTDGLVLRRATTGAPIRTLAPGPDPFGRPAFSPSGTLIAAVQTIAGSAAPDGITVWEVALGRRLARLPVARGPEGCRCGFLPGGVLLGSVFGLKEVPPVSTAWDLASDPGRPRLLARFDGMSAAGTEWIGGDLLTLGLPASVALRSPSTATTVRTFAIDGVNQGIRAVACTADAELVAAVSEPPRQLTVWDGKTGRRLAAHTVPPDIVRLVFGPGGASLAAVDVRQDVHLIDRRSGAARRISWGERGHPRPSIVAFSPDGTRLATAVSSDRGPDDASRVSLWDAAMGRRVATFPGRAEQPEDLTFTRDGRSLLISSRSGVRLWRLPCGEADADRQPDGHKDEAWSVTFSRDGRVVATGSDDSEPDPTIKLWDPSTGRLMRAWAGGEGTVSSLAFAPDGRVLATGHLASSRNVRVWDAATGHLLATLDGHTDRVRAVAFSPVGRVLASAGRDGTVRLWDLDTRSERQVLRGHGDTVHAIAFAPDGRTLASAGNEGDIRLWQIGPDGGASLNRTLHNRANLMALAYSPDGRLIAAADTLGSIAVWDLARATPLRIIHGDGDELRQLAFAPDGTALAAGGIKGTIRVWDPVTGQELLGLAAHGEQINGLAFSPDGSILASAAHDGTVRLSRAGP